MRSQGELRRPGWSRAGGGGAGLQGARPAPAACGRQGTTRPGLPGNLGWGGDAGLAQLGTEWQPAQRRQGGAGGLEVQAEARRQRQDGGRESGREPKEEKIEEEC